MFIIVFDRRMMATWPHFWQWGMWTVRRWCYLLNRRVTALYDHSSDIGGYG